MIEIHFTRYVENSKLFLSQKSQFDIVEKTKDKNKKRTCASLFQFSMDRKQEKNFMGPYSFTATHWRKPRVAIKGEISANRIFFSKTD